MKPRISVIVPVYNDEDNLVDCIKSLQEQSISEPFEILVVEDGSESGLKDKMKKFRNVRFFWKKNGGPASARNFAIRKAKCNLIAFIDSDCVADRNWLKNLNSELKQNKNYLGVIGKISNYYDSVLSEALHTLEFGWWGGSKYQEVEVAITCNSIFRKKELESVGLFGKFDYYGEDIDLGQKLVGKFEKKILYSPKPEIRHRTRSTVRNLVRKMGLSGKGFYLTRRKYPKMNFSKLLENKQLFFFSFLLLPFASTVRTLYWGARSKTFNAWNLFFVTLFVLIGYFSFWSSVGKEVLKNEF